MARILAYTSPARGHLYPLTPILGELRQRGHLVAVRTLASEVPLMRSLGFDAAPMTTAGSGSAMTRSSLRALTWRFLTGDGHPVRRCTAFA